MSSDSDNATKAARAYSILWFYAALGGAAWGIGDKLFHTWIAAIPIFIVLFLLTYIRIIRIIFGALICLILLIIVGAAITAGLPLIWRIVITAVAALFSIASAGWAFGFYDQI